ncbi:hypothetical protein K440DRAFT_624420 [Wilcoxina mikolae CBS 423.85]|nr:hypothetical protein K440DRAFT_624420 [Wilcoxina mikolae CBS 423.85]
MRFPLFSSHNHSSRSHDPDDTEPFLPSRLRSKNPPFANKLFSYFPCVLNLLLGTTLIHLLLTTQPRDTFPRTYCLPPPPDCQKPANPHSTGTTRSHPQQRRLHIRINISGTEYSGTGCRVGRTV